ncbi:MAG TPA: hypothetical protein VD905_19245, partial [Flavobacteriales bacterium]|nr:hypothetical protein [Flavobacteriales bacterium]
FLIGTNVYIALIATFIALSGFFTFNTPGIWINTAFVFFATQSAYNLQRYFKWRNHHLHAFLEPIVPATKKNWYSLIGISAAGMIGTGLFLYVEQFILLGFTGIVTSLYVFAHPTKKTLTGLRYIPFLKTILVAFCWTGIFFTLTYTTRHFFMLKAAWPYWLIVFLQVWQACVLFDLRDLESDKGHLRTFANTLTRDGMFGFWALFFIAIAGLSAYYGQILFVIPIYVVIAVIHMVCIYRKTSGLNFTFLVDGSLVLYAFGNWILFNH